MARNNSNYNLTLTLMTNIEKALKKAQGSIKKFIKSATFNIAAAMGLGSLGQDALSTAKALDKAEITLKNVSNGLLGFRKNQEFVRRLAEDYNQDIITLTHNFAKFTAAAKDSGMALSEQQHIYESLTRASAFYNLSADETNGVMLAVEQMLSKSKISAEELRRQLGERLPGAFTLMAKSLGISTAELDKMLRTGGLLAKDALPAFANSLDEVTGNLNLDNITSNLNRLGNSFTKIVDKSGLRSMMNEAIKIVTSGLNTIADHFKNFAIIVGSILGSIGINKLWKNLVSVGELKKKETGAKAMEKAIVSSLQIPTDSRSLFSGLEHEFVVNGKKITDWSKLVTVTVDRTTGKIAYRFTALGRQMKKAEKDMMLNFFRENIDILGDEVEEFSRKGSQLGKASYGLGKKMKSLWLGIKALFKSFLPTAIIAAALAGISKVISYFRNLKKEIKDYRKQLDDIDTDYGGQISKAESKPGSKDATLKKLKEAYLEQKAIIDDTSKSEAVRNIALENQQKNLDAINTMLGRQGSLAFTLKSRYEEVGDAIEKMLDKFRGERKEEAIREAYDTAMANRETIDEEVNTNREEVSRLRRQIDERDNSEQAIIPLQKWAKDWFDNNDLKNAEKKLAMSLNKRTANEKEIAKLEEDLKYLYRDQVEDAESDEALAAQLKYGEIQEKYAESLAILIQKNRDGLLTADELNRSRKNLAESTLDEVYALDRSIVGTDDFTRSLLALAKMNFEVEKKERTLDDELGDIIKDYEKDRKELELQFRNGAITQEEYNDAIADLTIDTWKALSALKDYTEGIDEAADAIRRQAEYEKNRRKQSEIDELKKDNAPGEWKLPTGRNTAEDYAKTSSEVMEEKLDYLNDVIDSTKDRIDTLKESIEALGDYAPVAWTEELKRIEAFLSMVENKADNVDDALALEKARNAVQQYNEELEKGTYDAMKNVAGGMRTLVESMRDLGEIMDDTDASPFEKMLSIFDAISQVINVIVTQVEQLKELEKVGQMLSGAEDALSKRQRGENTIETLSDLGLPDVMGGKAEEAAGIDMVTEALNRENAALAAQESINRRLLEQMALQQSLGQDSSIEQRIAGVQAMTQATDGLANSILSTSVAETSAAQKSVANSGAKVAASQAEAMGKGAASAASLPFPANIAAIVATIAAIAGMFATIKASSKFASGGIVGGNRYTGDLNLIRANSGEMVLNKNQQNRLWNLINGSGTVGGTGGQVKFEISGDKLVGVLRNHGRKFNN